MQLLHQAWAHWHLIDSRYLQPYIASHLWFRPKSEVCIEDLGLNHTSGLGLNQRCEAIIDTTLDTCSHTWFRPKPEVWGNDVWRGVRQWLLLLHKAWAHLHSELAQSFTQWVDTGIYTTTLHTCDNIWFRRVCVSMRQHMLSRPYMSRYLSTWRKGGLKYCSGRCLVTVLPSVLQWVTVSWHSVPAVSNGPADCVAMWCSVL